METSKTISRKKPDLQSQRYDELRELGLAYVRELSKKIWTDYNTHDPGVTMLEVLCYAITDLGHRAGQRIEDILAPEPGNARQQAIKNFYSAAQILPSRPVTLNDLRKLIIDTAVEESLTEGEPRRVGVKNAWIEANGEPEIPVWARKSQSLLQTHPKSAADPQLGRLEIAPLYEVLLEFEYSELYGDLNRNIIREQFTLGAAEIAALRQVEVRAEIVFPRWDSSDTEWDDPAAVLASAQSLGLSFFNVPAGFSLNAAFDAQNRPILSGRDADGIELVLDSVLAIINDRIDAWVSMYRGRVGMVLRILSKVKARLHANRGLCEDYLSFTALRVESITVCADIELGPGADVHLTEARILHEISRYLSPSVHFAELQELLDQKVPVEQIFEGPLLDHGFIPDSELGEAGRRKVIYVSDLIQIIMNIEGVVAVRHIEVANEPEIPDPEVRSRSVRWCLELAWERNYVPRLSPQRSTLTYYKEDLPLSASPRRVEALLTEFRMLETQTRPEVRLRDLRIPEGKWLGLDRYTSIGEDFPAAWGLSSDGLSPAADELRRTYVKQLQGYLLFFEQLLANYLSQLAGVRELFSMNAEQDEAGNFSIGKTYFTQAIDSIIPEGRTLLTDPLNYPENLQRIAESQALFLRRRNAFLDHLLARFAENFTDYATMVRGMAGTAGKRRLIRDKLGFLNHYPEISAARGLGFNYQNCGQIWHIDNRSGLQKRVTLLNGMNWPGHASLVFSPGLRCLPSGEDWKIEIHSDGALVLESSEGAFETEEQAKFALEHIVLSGTRADAYRISENEGVFSLALRYHGGNHVSSPAAFATVGEAEVLRDELITLFTAELFDNAEANRNNLRAPLTNYFEINTEHDDTNYRIRYRLSQRAFSVEDEDLLMTGETRGSGASVAEAERLMAERTEEFIWDVAVNGGRPERYRYIPRDGAWVLMLCGTGLEPLGYSTGADFNQFVADWLNDRPEKYIRLTESGSAIGYAYESATASGADVIIRLEEGHGITRAPSETSLAQDYQLHEAYEPRTIRLPADAARQLYTVTKVILHLPETETQPASDTALEIDAVEEGAGFTRIRFSRTLPQWRAGTRLSFNRFFDVRTLSGNDLILLGGMEHRETGRLVAFFIQKFLSREGFHVTEHLLLRPRETDDALLPIFIDPNCKHCGLDNPYSHICSVVLPYWPQRFQNPDFRRFLERKIREEAPAHVFLKICWVSNQQMQAYEAAKKRWLMEVCTEQAGAGRAEALGRLIEVLFSLRNVYPSGRLHDCNDPESLEEAIFLNNSSLGNS